MFLCPVPFQNYSSVFLSDTISVAVRNSAAVSASVADDRMYFSVCAIDSTGPFHRGKVSSSERNMWAPALLLDPLSLLKPASQCPHRVISLDL